MSKASSAKPRGYSGMGAAELTVRVNDPELAALLESPG